KGLYLNGNNVILSYTVGSTPVLEMPSLESSGDLKVFARIITLGPSAIAQALLVADVNDRNENRTKEEYKDKGVTKTRDVVEYNFTPAAGKIENGIAHIGI